MNLVFLILQPVFYIFLAGISLTWFAFAYERLMFLLRMSAAYPALNDAQPLFKTIIDSSQKIFGPAERFNPSTTHVILVAILIVLMVELGRLQRCITAGQQR